MGCGEIQCTGNLHRNPSSCWGQEKEILEICKNTGCKLKILPSMAQIVNDEVRVSNLREVEIEDLLGREQVKTNLDEVMGYIAGRVVLVTGGEALSEVSFADRLRRIIRNS